LSAPKSIAAGRLLRFATTVSHVAQEDVAMTVDLSAFSTEYSFDRNRSGRAGAAYGPAQLADVDAPAVYRDPIMRPSRSIWN
jgi:hypothetical protein